MTYEGIPSLQHSRRGLSMVRCDNLQLQVWVYKSLAKSNNSDYDESVSLILLLSILILRL